MKVEEPVRVVRDGNERYAVVIIVFDQNIIALRRCNLGDVPARQFNRELGRATLSISFVVEYSIIYIVSLEQRLDDTVVDVARIMLESHGVVAGSRKISRPIQIIGRRQATGEKQKDGKRDKKGICPPEKESNLIPLPSHRISVFYSASPWDLR